MKAYVASEAAKVLWVHQDRLYGAFALPPALHSQLLAWHYDTLDQLMCIAAWGVGNTTRTRRYSHVDSDDRSLAMLDQL